MKEFLFFSDTKVDISNADDGFVFRPFSHLQSLSSEDFPKTGFFTFESPFDLKTREFFYFDFCYLKRWAKTYHNFLSSASDEQYPTCFYHRNLKFSGLIYWPSFDCFDMKKVVNIFQDCFELEWDEDDLDFQSFSEPCRINLIPDYRSPIASGEKKVLFLDRDGIININHGYIGEVERVELFDGFVDFIVNAYEHNFEAIVLTNQSGVARGYYQASDVNKVHEHMRCLLSDHFLQRGLDWQKFSLSQANSWIYCPYHENSDNPDSEYACKSIDRKPLPGMLLQACEKFNLSLCRAKMIGDSLTDRFRYIEIDTYLKDVAIKSSTDASKSLDNGLASNYSSVTFWRCYEELFKLILK